MEAKTLIDSLKNELKRAELSSFSDEQLTALNELCRQWAEKTEKALAERGPAKEEEGWLARQNDFL
ncbi:hypothetical protein [Allohahella sp. A8]|uniref:hypothetical protein n=1 Tax=Allohahella sp. A8 TaxID=3141461 RepID=UPI000C093818|nr:hypothetical protein [Hahellaceae bacterium]|tara:strand:+ start:122714 stop:122911 length:198 start_codon:yes stop_codon:yes gene_type:complete